MSTATRAVIVVVLPDLRLGGGQRAVLEVTRQLLSAGHRVELVCLQGEEELANEVPAGVGYHALRIGANGAVLLAIRALPALMRLLRRLRPDAVLSSMTGTNLLTSIAHGCANCPSRLVLREAVSLDNTRSAFVRWLMARLYRRAEALVAVSSGVGEDLISLGLDSTRIHVVHNPVNGERLRRLASCERPRPTSPLPYIVSIGRLTAQKDQRTLVRAYAASTLRNSHRLVIVGEGEKRRTLVALARELGVTDKIDLLGAVTNPYPILAGAAMHVLSSRWEGYPNVLLEALALNVPVVATDCPAGPRELLQDGRFGRLTAVGDHLALAKAMEAELQAPAEERELAVAEHRPGAVAARYATLLLGSLEESSA